MSFRWDAKVPRTLTREGSMASIEDQDMVMVRRRSKATHQVELSRGSTDIFDENVSMREATRGLPPPPPSAKLTRATRPDPSR